MEKTVKKEAEAVAVTDKIWCPEKECIQYVKACEANCKKKYVCISYRDYIEPRLF